MACEDCACAHVARVVSVNSTTEQVQAHASRRGILRITSSIGLL